MRNIALYSVHPIFEMVKRLNSQLDQLLKEENNSNVASKIFVHISTESS